ncbi:uncharacterized protein LOC112494452 [Cephus cinctus]|uniref:Uncharacterized protein LOC112494452 n=1 Tax=Cephus cinctus TaxID=211228 RepID=A0AAJ7W1V7_CEPCN|nr:uncharacterized protein LOC112494452 [Cephus cinctus]
MSGSEDTEIEEKNEANYTKINESVVMAETKILEENKLTSDKNVQMKINVDSEKNESIDENVVTKVLTERTSINSISSNENEILKKCFDSENTLDNSERDMRVVMEKMSKSSNGNEIRNSDKPRL